MYKQLICVFSIAAILALTACSKTHSESDLQVTKTAETTELSNELVLYSSRNEQLILPLIEAYKKQTGTEIRFVTDKPEPLIEKIKAEAEQTPADILMTVDAGNLWRASQAGLFQSLDSNVLNMAVPEKFRDSNNTWFGFSQRARTIVYSTQRVSQDELSTYESLANEKWKGRLCLRTSKKVYNQSLVAMLLATQGVEKTESIVKGWVDNLATDPFSNDTKTMQAILAGQCDVAIVNTYYFGRLQKDNPDIELKLFWPNQNPDKSELAGVHVNISGAGVLKHAKNPDRALHFMEWMSGSEAQSILAKGNMEYPVVRDVDFDPLVASWGTFESDSTPLTRAGELQRQSVMLMDRMGYR